MILVIDQGTHATRAMVLDENGTVCFSAFCEICLKRIGTDRAEQNAEEIIASVRKVIRMVLANPLVRRRGIKCAGLATQRSTVAAWDKRTGKSLAPILSWQDRRAAAWLDRFSPYADTINSRTGLKLSPHYGASKLRWYLEHVPAVKDAQKKGYLAAGPLVSFLLFHLLEDAPLLADHANASRTQLWNIHTHNWDPGLTELFGIPQEILPSCLPICEDYGFLRSTQIPLTAVNGDQTAAIYSQGQPCCNTAIVNMGTGAFILLPTGLHLVRHPELLSGVSNSCKNHSEYIVEGTVNGAGSALDWAACEWNMPDIMKHLIAGFDCEKNIVSRSQTPAWERKIPLFINTVGGLGSPWWRYGAAPALVGDGESWQKAVAVAESIVFMLQTNLEMMDKAGLAVHQIQIGGGLSRVDGICQRLADLAQRQVYRPPETESTAQGIAWLASKKQECQTYCLAKPLTRGKSYIPRMNPLLHERYKRFREILDSVDISPQPY